MKEKLSLILSAISLVGVLSVWVLWMCESIEFSVVSLDSFVGVIVALLAIIVTVAIGYQIINAIEVKDEIKQLKQRQDIILENEQRLTDNGQNFIKLANNLQSGNSSSTAQLYAAKEEYFEAFVFFHSAFYFAIEADQPNQMTYISQLKELLKSIEKMPVIDYLQAKQEITSYSEKIRTSTSYRNCFGKEYEAIMKDFWDKMKQLGLENGKEIKQ